MSTSSTPVRDRLIHARHTADTRAMHEALPHWDRPRITPTGVPGVYRVPSESRRRVGLTHIVDMNREECGCESWVGLGHGAYPVGHWRRACKHIRSVKIYEAERASRASQAVDELCGTVAS